MDGSEGHPRFPIISPLLPVSFPDFDPSSFLVDEQSCTPNDISRNSSHGFSNAWSRTKGTKRSDVLGARRRRSDPVSVGIIIGRLMGSFRPGDHGIHTATRCVHHVIRAILLGVDGQSRGLFVHCVFAPIAFVSSQIVSPIFLPRRLRSSIRSSFVVHVVIFFLYFFLLRGYLKI